MIGGGAGAPGAASQSASARTGMMRARTMLVAKRLNLAGL